MITSLFCTFAQENEGFLFAEDNFFCWKAVTKGSLLHLKDRMAQKDDVSIIIRQVLSGDTEAFSLLLERYGGKVYGLVMRLVADELEAEELTQEAFVQAYIHLGEYQGAADFATWLYRIAYNTALMHLRRRRNVLFPIDERLADSVGDDEAEAALAEVTEERIVLLEAALQRLSPDDRMLVTLFYYEERPTRDIAYVLDTTVSNVTTRLHRVRKRLYLLMKQMDYGTEQ